MGGVTGGHNVMGVTAPAPRPGYFAEGYTGAGFDEYLTILNPNPAAAPVTITYYLGGGQAPVVKTLTVPASSRATVAVHDAALGVGRGQEVAAQGRDDQRRRRSSSSGRSTSATRGGMGERRPAATTSLGATGAARRLVLRRGLHRRRLRRVPDDPEPDRRRRRRSG